uniref:Acyl-CoA N-acyltransferase with RING/FYVE/PHD-type zinc finger protein n=1 Tax=Tanacetum cinerariifolium TaxID=118510 RepID=A0A699RCB5_TANCI|nr:acyl-CoA N-acyltransferase with RING/FYVE/PHD-type zinc finger protein [Tanacetum cinerariifolium]
MCDAFQVDDSEDAPNSEMLTCSMCEHKFVYLSVERNAGSIISIYVIVATERKKLVGDPQEKSRRLLRQGGV